MKTLNFRFSCDDHLRAVVAHAWDAGQHRKPYKGETPHDGAGLFLVKDEGAYLMSAAPGRQWKDDDDHSCGLVVAYAIGCTPADDWIGGDDFADLVPISKDVATAIMVDGAGLRVEVTETRLTVYVVPRAERPRRKPKARRTVQQEPRIN